MFRLFARYKQMQTHAKSDQSAILSRVESKNAPNLVPPFLFVKAATEPSKASARTKIVSKIVPIKSWPLIEIKTEVATSAMVPKIVTLLALHPNLTRSFAIGKITRLNPLLKDSNILSLSLIQAQYSNTSIQTQRSNTSIQTQITSKLITVLTKTPLKTKRR